MMGFTFLLFYVLMEKKKKYLTLEIYSGHKGLVKIKIGIGRGRKKEDKREYIKTRDAKREAKDASK
jgi:tmRNA-binding protein